MKKMKKLAFAVFTLVGVSGCASNQIADLVRSDAVQVEAAQQMVSRPLPSYGSMGGYRYRRLAAVVVAS